MLIVEMEYLEDKVIATHKRDGNIISRVESKFPRTFFIGQEILDDTPKSNSSHISFNDIPKTISSREIERKINNMNQVRKLFK
jgi:hypothetical protein